MQSRKVPLVLVVLDDSVGAEKLRRLFRQKDYETVTAPDFSGALKIIRKKKVDLIIGNLNLLLPEKEALSRSIGKDKNFAETPILILGTENGGKSILEALAGGADDFIEDPADELQILARAAKLIERKQAGDLLHESEGYFRSLIDNVSDIISILSFDGTILYESAAVERVLGHRPSDLTGKSAFDFIHPDDRERIVKYFYECAARNDQASLPVEYRYRDGANNWRIIESAG
jgi:PAS domain S-box-containing protein